MLHPAPRKILRTVAGGLLRTVIGAVAIGVSLAAVFWTAHFVILAIAAFPWWG